LTGSFALANTSDVTVPGPAKLAAFLEKNGISKRQAARDLRVSAPTVLDWLNEVKAPEKQNRTAIRVYTRGEVVEDDWATEKEIAAAERAAEVRPFEPASEPAAHESGEHAATVDPPKNGTEHG
jgi:hypothetical protein